MYETAPANNFVQDFVSCFIDYPTDVQETLAIYNAV